MAISACFHTNGSYTPNTDYKLDEVYNNFVQEKGWPKSRCIYNHDDDVFYFVANDTILWKIEDGYPSVIKEGINDSQGFTFLKKNGSIFTCTNTNYNEKGYKFDTEGSLLGTFSKYNWSGCYMLHTDSDYCYFYANTSRPFNAKVNTNTLNVDAPDYDQQIRAQAIDLRIHHHKDGVKYGFYISGSYSPSHLRNKFQWLIFDDLTDGANWQPIGRNYWNQPVRMTELFNHDTKEIEIMKFTTNQSNQWSNGYLYDVATDTEGEKVINTNMEGWEDFSLIPLLKFKGDIFYFTPNRLIKAQ